MKLVGEQLVTTEARVLRSCTFTEGGHTALAGSLTNNQLPATHRLAFLDDSLVYASHTPHVFDISRPAEPRFVGEGSSWTPTTVGTGEGDLLALVKAGVPVLIDFSDPENPRELAAINSITNIAEMQMEAGLLAIRHGRFVTLFDVSRPESPQFRSRFLVRLQQSRMKLRDRHLFLMQPSNGFEIFDLSDPTAPVRLRGSSLYSPADIALSGDVFYTIESSSVVHRYAVNPPSNFRLTNAQWRAEGLQFRIHPIPSQPVQLQESTNLLDWQDYAPIVPGLEFIQIPATEPYPGGRYFRVKQN